MSDTLVPDRDPVTPVGGVGTVAGTRTPADDPDDGPGPTPFVATTLKVYVVPGESPMTVQVVPAEAHVKLPGVDVAV